MKKQKRIEIYKYTLSNGDEDQRTKKHQPNETISCVCVLSFTCLLAAAVVVILVDIIDRMFCWCCC